MFRIIPEGKNFSEYVLLRDGLSVHLRAAGKSDVPAVEALIGSVSPDSLRMRFMGTVAYVSPKVIEMLCEDDAADRLSLLAIVGHAPDYQVVGIGSYVSLGVGGKAEVSFLVRDEYQGRGVSTLLLERLAGIAAGSGFVGFEAEVLYENQPMINVFRDSGFEVHQALDGGSIHVDFPVGGMASLRERVELRDRIAAANSLVPLLQPKVVAVVGASRDPDAIGSLIFRSLLRGNFSGTAYPVNNQTAAVHGVRSYPSVSELPEPADLVVVAVPAAGVAAVAEEALHAGTKGLLVVASGFAETGEAGRAAQNRLVELVRSHGARLIGPNCLGVINTHPDVSLNASPAPAMPPRGRIGFYSHSAALGLVVLSYAAERGLGFSTFVSAGNRADVSGNDLLQFWEEDPSTDIALLYLEAFGNPRRFARIARRVSYRKPILCVKSARSRAGLETARAHIGAVAQSETAVDVLFRQAGVIRADTLEQLFDVAVLLANQPLPRGDRVSIISNSGGVLTLCADACEANGLRVAGPGVVDLGPLATVGEYEDAVQQAMEHEEVDALIAMYACVGNCDPGLVGRGLRRGVARARRRTGAAKPALLCLMGAEGVLPFGVDEIGGAAPDGHVFPSYRFPESAALALARTSQYADFRRRPGGRIVWYEDADPAAARRAVKAALDAEPGPVVWLEGEPAREILHFFGIRSGGAVQPASSAGRRPVAVEVRSDASFGPLIRLVQEGSPPLVRITPLTDHDAREMVGSAGFAESGMDELLCRVSQMVEELPWLCGMYADTAFDEARAGAGRVSLGQGLTIGFCRSSAPPG